MKTTAYLFFLLMSPFLFSCDDDKDKDEDEEPDRTTNLVTLQNNTGQAGSGFCFPNEPQVTFIVSYRDIQVDASINSGGAQGFINVLVEDGESINVRVQRTSDDTVIANANVNVRTTSRPLPEDTPRRIIYCEPFELEFEGF